MAAIGTRCVIVTAAAGPDTPHADFVSRVFAPNVGLPEDPVTGSAHCSLAVHWAARLGRTDLVGEQVSRRGGTVRMSVRGDRVTIAGQAVTVATTTLVA
jgi:predicted PhzF superfamily epimerase YddE/YHI9